MKASMLLLCVAMTGLLACSEDEDKGTEKKVTNYPEKVNSTVIYGDDDRLDFYQIEDESIRSRAQQTVAFVENGSLRKANDGTYSLRTSSYSDSYRLCSKEPFSDQRLGAFCSGFLVGPDLVATAGHCVTSNSECHGISLVFDFAMTSKENLNSQFNEDQVYKCSQLIKSTVASDGSDFALIRLDRPVVGREPVNLRQDGQLKVRDPIFVIGYPAGLPVKYAGGANIRSVQNQFYTANLDTYGGNSGSAVFNAETGDVEGILVRGDTDYVTENGCRVSNRCSNSGCRGEDVTKISHIVNLLNDLEVHSTPSSLVSIQ